MSLDDIPEVLQIEQQSYSHPWTDGIFKDCLKVGYPAWVIKIETVIVGYVVLSVGAGEAHILNICIASNQRRKGLASAVLKRIIELMIDENYRSLFLEVRLSNTAAARLYENLGFKKIGLRKAYYKNGKQREDAITYTLDLIEESRN